MQAWNDLLLSLVKTIGEKAVEDWLKPIKIIKFDAANLHLEATPFQQAWFEEHVRPLIKNFCNSNQRPIRIHWNFSRKHPSQGTNTPEKGCAFHFSPNTLEKIFSLDTFITDEKTKVIKEIAKELATGTTISFNPVVFVGPKGSGKTHLLMAIANHLQALGKLAWYIKADTFADHVVQAIRLGGMQEVRNTYRSLDVLLVEDIQTFARKNATQEEFFHTFNALHSAGKQIILSANEPINQLVGIEQRLTSRFEWGVSLSLSCPNEDTLVKILEHKAHLLKYSLSQSLAHFLIKNFPSSSKAPIEALHVLALRSPKGATIHDAKTFLKDLLCKEEAFILTPEKIVRQTATYFGIKIEDILGESHMRQFAQPRKIAMYLCRNLLDLPYQKIGHIFHRDHSTVLSNIRYVEEEKQEAPFIDAVDHLLMRLKRK